MWSSMQGLATMSPGHLLAFRHEFSDDGNTEAQGLSDPHLFCCKRFAHGGVTGVARFFQGGLGAPQSPFSQETRPLWTCQEHLLMGRMFYKGGTGMQWEYYWSFPKYLSLLVSSSPMWQSTTLTSFVEATQGKVKVHDLARALEKLPRLVHPVW